MKKALIGACAIVLTLLTPVPAFAWGFAGHRLIMRRAIELLPMQLRPFFDSFKEEIVVRVVDPDLWRNVGWEDDPHHFIDFGVREYGAYPFRELPREYDAALEKFGDATLKRNGLLPWRTSEQFGNLRRTFEEFKRAAPYTVSNLVLFSAVTAHYTQDAFQPFHTTDNYDGAATGNNGIHARFERDLIERFESRLTLTPAAPKPIGNIRDNMFDVALASFVHVDPILAADTAAAAGRETYDDVYFEKFFVAVKPMLDRQLSLAISGTASVIISAWEQAGRPTVRLRDDRSPQRVRPR